MQLPRLCLLPLLLIPAAAQTVYLIRHGEKPEDDDSHGLSEQGVQRAQCLRNVFGSSSSYDIGYLIAQQPKDDGARQRPYLTLKPLGEDLGLTVDTSCDRDDPDCVKDLVKEFGDSGSTQNILLAWEHKVLTDIVETLGDDDAPEYPDDSYNLIWTDPSPYDHITSTTSEECPGLDD